MVSLTNFPSQTTLLLPGPEMPSFQHLDNSSANPAAFNNNDASNFVPINNPEYTNVTNERLRHLHESEIIDSKLIPPPTRANINNP